MSLKSCEITSQINTTLEQESLGDVQGSTELRIWVDFLIGIIKNLKRINFKLIIYKTTDKITETTMITLYVLIPFLVPMLTRFIDCVLSDTSA